MKPNPSHSSATDVSITERLQPITVETTYLGGYKSEVQVRDLPRFYFDEPKELGGNNAGPTPLEGVLGSLCACTSMIVHIIQKEMSFGLTTMRCQAKGVTDIRRVEMKRTGKKYSEIEPLSYHFHEVHQTIWVVTSESDERLDELKAHVARLCPVSRLLEDAKVSFTVDWIRE
jgi:uncharacterized OsmC-like protein